MNFCLNRALFCLEGHPLCNGMCKEGEEDFTRNKGKKGKKIEWNEHVQQFECPKTWRSVQFTGGGGGGGGFRLKPHIEVRFKWMWFPIGIFQSPNFSLREGSKKKFDTASSRGYRSSLTGASTARFDFVVTMFWVGKIDEDTVDCPRFVAFKGASREDSPSSFNLGELTKRIHGESDQFDEEEARQVKRKDRRRRAPFYLESPIGFTFTWNRPLCVVLMLLGGGGGADSQTSSSLASQKPRDWFWQTSPQKQASVHGSPARTHKHLPDAQPVLQWHWDSTRSSSGAGRCIIHCTANPSPVSYQPFSSAPGSWGLDCKDLNQIPAW